jgi:eukaryotic-like serine/threonine-protein kinase
MPKGSLIEDPRRRDNVPPENNSLMSPKVGSQLGRYKLLSPLGAGAMAEVYLAQDTKLGRSVALKLLPDRLAVDDSHLHRFEQEARAASK